MLNILDFPIAILALSLVTLWLFTQIGALLVKRLRPIADEELTDLDVVKNSALTLLVLLIGFSFSMAVNRYDQRKSYEAEEANAIGTEYVRARLLPSADSEKVRELLRSYLDLRVLFYETRDERRLGQINDQTAKLQDRLWSAVQGVAAPPNPVAALSLGGMNDVLNTLGYTQAAWWNRIPVAAWLLMMAIALCCSLLIGYGARGRASVLFVVLPLVMSIAFFLIADIDSPRGGVIRVHAQNLASLAQSLRVR